MPRRPAVLAVLLLAVALLLPRLAAAQEALGPDSPYLLTMPDLSSPRATLEAIMTNGDIVEQEFLSRGPSWTPRPSMRRMVETIDSSEMSAAHRMLAAALTAVRLKVTLSRLPPERLASAPDADAVRRNGIKQWTVPGTPITLALTETGPNAGQFRFTPATAALAADLYQASMVLAHQDGRFARALDNWATTPGPLLPAGLVAALPAPLQALWAGQALWQWIGLVLLVVVAVALSFTAIRWGLRHDRHEARPIRRFGQPLAALVLMGCGVATMLLAFFGLKIWGDSLGLLILVLKAIVYLAFAWFGIATVQRIGALAVQTSGLSSTSIDGQMVRVVCTLLGIGIGLVAGFTIADLFGVPVGPLLAGLGIGGLAIALAIRPTLENVIGGLTLFADRPIRVGEFCRFGNESGTVEEIGLRTTKVRRLDDTLVTIPNSELAQIRIENITRRRRFLFAPRLGLRYETTPDQVLAIEKAIMAMLEAHPKVQDDGVRIRFTSFGDYTLNLDVFAYVDVTRMPDFVAVQEDLNLRIMEIVTKAGAAFAFPSQTTYLARELDPVRVVIRAGAVLAGLLLAAPAIAQHAHHAAPPVNVPAPTQPGQAAFAAIAEVVAILEADPTTDWSRADIEALRRHLADMDNVTLRATATATPVPGGMAFAVTGEGAVRESVRRMVSAHAQAMNGAGGWSYAAAITDGGATLTVLAPPSDLAKLRALGFIGVMTRGMHHQAHHLMIARGMGPHP